LLYTALCLEARMPVSFIRPPLHTCTLPACRAHRKRTSFAVGRHSRARETASTNTRTAAAALQHGAQDMVFLTIRPC
jgi:hypothetical protein